MSMWDAYGEKRIKIDDAPKGMQNEDNVNHPSHYQSKYGLEAKYVIEAFTDGLNGYDAFCAGNAIKYILRWNHKNGKEDLRKAKWYIDELLKEKKIMPAYEKKEDAYGYTE